jgi:RHS repeat-associated protein
MAFGVPVNQGSQSPEVSYGGAPLALNGATHYWRIKFWDAADAEGAWSTVTATFKMYDATIEVLQDLNFTYDNNGNITQIVDASETDTAKTVAYVYDDLNRLTSAIATDVASGQSTYSPAFAYNVFETATSTNPASRQLTYTHIFAYNAIGNFINKSDVGNYSYAGTNYANPHAATSINNITQTYDNNGNLTGDGTWTHTWDYKNRLIQSTKTGTTAIYAYDQNGARAKFYNGTTMIITASPYYSKEGSLDVKYIYVGDKIVATVRGTGASAAVYYMHTDHLGSSAVVTNNDGEVRELSDYFAYGEQRIHETVNFDDRKGYIGKDYDTATTLSQLEARYYRSKQGRFISEDPMFWSLPAVLLVDPQQQNSYSYGRDNPITNSDPSGRMTIKQMAQTFINSVNSIFGRSTPTIQSQAVQAENSKTNANVGNSPTVLNSPVGNASITSSFGSDRSDCSVCSKIHGGTDYGVRVGTPVYATAPGTVVRSDWSNSLGNTVVIEHLKLSTRNDGVYTLYGHGSSLSVESGQPVNTGDIIMYSGNTGKSTGAHLHYEVIKSPFQFGSNSFYADKPNYTFGPEALSGFLAK